MKTRLLDETWLKAASLGCLWASAEISLGSFLHNLRVPLTGYVLASIGVILMISVGHLWPERGLFWRAGLVCALMKALSPSAVLLMPMIAIAGQACMMELSVRMFGRHAFSYLLGAMLAMSWNMGQIVIRTLISYGRGAIDLYLALVRWSERALGASFGPSWVPVLLMFALSLAVGLTAGTLGVLIGRKAAAAPLTMSSLSREQVKDLIRYGQPARAFPYSLGWLTVDLVLIVALLMLVGSASWKVWLPAGALTAAIWIRRYRGAVRRLLRPGFWIGFILLTALSGALLSSVKSGWAGVLHGISAGLTMNFRAAVLIIGFSALGTELRSPWIVDRIYRGRFRQLPAAMEAAVETLPLVMANLPKAGDALHRPVTVFQRMVALSDFSFKRLTLRQLQRKGVMLLSGGVGTGKSTALERLVDGLRADGLRVAGILAPAVTLDGARLGYDLIDLSDGRRTELSRTARRGEAGSPSVGPFTFNPEGLRAGQAALSPERAAAADVIVVDEVGPWELLDQGWAASLYKLALETDTPMIWIVRSEIRDQVRSHWALHDPLIAELSDVTPEALRRQARDWLGRGAVNGAQRA